MSALIVPYLKLGKGSGDRGAWIGEDVPLSEGCNLRLDSNQPEFLWYGVRAEVAAPAAPNTPKRVLSPFMFVIRHLS